MIDFFKKKGKDVEDASAYSLAIRAHPQRPEDTGVGKTAEVKKGGVGDALGRLAGGGSRMLGTGIVDFLNALDPHSATGQKLVQQLASKGSAGPMTAAQDDISRRTIGGGALGLGGVLGYKAMTSGKEDPEKPQGNVTGAY